MGNHTPRIRILRRSASPAIIRSAEAPRAAGDRVSVDFGHGDSSATVAWGELNLIAAHTSRAQSRVHHSGTSAPPVHYFHPRSRVPTRSLHSQGMAIDLPLPDKSKEGIPEFERAERYLEEKRELAKQLGMDLPEE